MVGADQKFIVENGMRMIHLKEVFVKGRKKESPKSIFSYLANNSYDEEQIKEAGYNSIKEILQRISGVTVSGDRVSIRSNSTIYSEVTPTLVVDGMIVSQEQKAYVPKLNQLHQWMMEQGILKV